MTSCLIPMCFQTCDITKGRQGRRPPPCQGSGGPPCPPFLLVRQRISIKRSARPFADPGRGRNITTKTQRHKDTKKKRQKDSSCYSLILDFFESSWFILVACGVIPDPSLCTLASCPYPLPEDPASVPPEVAQDLSHEHLLRGPSYKGPFITPGLRTTKHPLQGLPNSGPGEPLR